jgi:hypothetical protein
MYSSIELKPIFFSICSPVDETGQTVSFLV